MSSVVDWLPVPSDAPLPPSSLTLLPAPLGPSGTTYVIVNHHEFVLSWYLDKVRPTMRPTLVQPQETSRLPFPRFPAPSSIPHPHLLDTFPTSSLPLSSFLSSRRIPRVSTSSPTTSRALLPSRSPSAARTTGPPRPSPYSPCPRTPPPPSSSPRQLPRPYTSSPISAAVPPSLSMPPRSLGPPRTSWSTTATPSRCVEPLPGRSSPPPSYLSSTSSRPRPRRRRRPRPPMGRTTDHASTIYRP